MMFQRAAPELNGFGVTTSTSLVSTSSRVLMPSGLPLRTMITTTESWAMPLYLLLVPVFGDEAAFFDEPFHVAGLGEVDDRCGLAGDDRAALVAGGAEGVAEADASALGGFLEGRLEGFGVDGFRGGVADHVELAAAEDEPPSVEPELVLSSLLPQPAAKTARSIVRSAAGRPTFTLRRRVLRAFRIDVPSFFD